MRGSERISFNRPDVWFCIGGRGTGKWTFLETLACHHLEKKHTVLDLFGSRDGEGLAWLRSPYAEDRRVLLLRGEAASVDASHDAKTVSELKLRDFEDYDIIISSSPLYSSPDDEFISAAALTDKFYKRLNWKRLVYALTREAANLFYSRLKVSENQVVAKAQMTYLLRESRHMGFSLDLDTTRFFAIDIDIRNLSDYIILKAMGMQGLVKDLHWLYSIFEPFVIRNMSPENFYLLSRKGNIATGLFNEIPWHKRPRENILKSVGIDVEHGEPVEAGEYRGTYRTVGDKEHAEIIKLYVEEGLSVDKIADKLKRSTRTPHKHIKAHNRAVDASGFCPSCRRVKSKHESTVAVRG